MSPASADIHALLGPLVREHRTRWTYILAVAAVALLFGIVAVTGTARVAVRILEDPSGETVTLGLMTTLPFWIAGAIAGVWVLRRVKKVIVLHQGGFHYRDGAREHVVPWQTIDGIYQRIVRVYSVGEEVDVRDEYTICLRDGTSLSFDYHFQDVEAFGGALTSAVTTLALPWYRQAFRAGHPIDFGPVRLDGYGVHTSGKSLPWHEVEGISWKAGILASDRAFLMVRRRGGLLAWAKVPVEEIKNYQVLMAIAADMGKAE
jgi:hypothetical protein